MNLKLIRVCFALILSLFSGAAAASEIAPSERVKRSVMIRSEPSTNAPIVERLVPGQVAVLVEELPGWYQVRLVDGRTGFVSKSWTIIVGQDGAALASVSTVRVHVIDVGTGLATFVESQDFTLLYDGGSQDDLAMGAANRIAAYIRAVRPGLAKIDHLILSHPHKDHLQLLPDIFDQFAVSHVWDSGAVNKTLGYCRFLAKVEAEPAVQYHNALATGGVHEVQFSNTKCKSQIRIKQAAQMTANSVPLGNGARMTLLYRDARPHHDPNENSVVVRLDVGSRRILMAGDAEAGERELPASPPQADSIEGSLLSCCASDLRADVLIVGHHGSKTSSRTAFLDAVGATVYVISSGPFSYRGIVLPDAAVVEELARRGRILRTDKDDEACVNSEAKIGADADESPGGCHNVLITVKSGSVVTAEYNEIAD
jgi:competence protein ComEC